MTFVPIRNQGLLAVALGVVWGTVTQSLGWGSVWLFGVVVLVAGFTLLLSRVGVSHKKTSYLVFVLLVSIAAGASWTGLYQALHKADPTLGAQTGMEVRLSGWVCREPDERETHVKVTLCDLESGGEEYGGKLLVTSGLYPEWQYGDALGVTGTLDAPENFTGETGREFEYVGYLAKSDIHFIMYYPEVEKLGDGFGNPIQGALFAFKEAFLQRVAQVIHEPYVSLLGGLVVGAKQSLGESLLEAFRETGVIHIVVLSGYNVTIVALGLMAAFSFLPRRAGVSVGAIAIVLFAVMVGAGATVVRASIMALLVILARSLGREFDVTRALLIAGLVMVLHNPLIVVFDPSFQLSFLATVGLIYVGPIVERFLSFMPTGLGIREVAVATISTQIFVLPAILYMMGEFSVVAVVVNLLILLVIPATMLFGFLAGMIGFISRVLSLPFAFIAFLLLYYELLVIEWFAALPFASVTVKPFSFLWVIVAYMAMGIVLLWFHRPWEARREPASVILSDRRD